MPETKRPLKVFLCHASQDKSVVRELYNALKSEGWIDPWLDKAKILPGQDWRTVIEKAVEDADVVIVCLSNQSVSKEGFVQREIKYAYDIALEKPEETIFLIPLRLDNCTVPRGLRSFHWVNYFDTEKNDAYSDLLDSLKLRHQQKLLIEEELSIQEKERQERLATERAAREKAERDAAESAAIEKAEREGAEKAARQQAKRETAEKIARERAEKAARQEEKRDAAEKAKRKRVERQALQMATLTGKLSNSLISLKSSLPKAMPFLRIAGFAGIIIGVLWMVLPEIPKPLPFFSVAKPTTTVTFTVSPLIATKTPTKLPAQPLTATKTTTLTPTATLTPTPISPSSILFQKDFEDSAIGEWSWEDGVWAIEQEPDGNHCMSGSGPANGTTQIWYQNEQTNWTDYALETRVKFIKGHTLYILIRSNAEYNEHYGVAVNDYGFGLMHTWSSISSNIPMLPYPDGWYTIRTEIKGDSFSTYIESAYLDSPLFQEITLHPPVIHQGGFGYVINNEDKVCFDNIRAWSLK